MFCSSRCGYQNDTIDCCVSLGYISTEFLRKMNTDVPYHAPVKCVVAREKSANLVCLRKALQNTRAGTLHRCTGVSRYTPHGTVHDTQYLYRGTLRYAIAVGKTLFTPPL